LLAVPHAALAAASKGPPAGGAAIGQVIGATAAATLLTTALLVLGMGHRNGRGRVLSRASDSLSGLTGLPGWAVLPSPWPPCRWLAAVFGLYWDVSLHIDNGRDPGPLANPAHYFILFGLFGIFTAGWLAIVLPTSVPARRRPHLQRLVRPVVRGPAHGLRLVRAPGLPLDDIWHRLFGQGSDPSGARPPDDAHWTAMSLRRHPRLPRRGRAAGEQPLARPAILRGLLTSQHARTLRLVSA